MDPGAEIVADDALDVLDHPIMEGAVAQ